MSDEYGADLVTVLDDEGNEHQFELLDAIETENGEDLLVPIEDDAVFDEIAEIFEERLSDLYEVEELESPADEEPLN